MPFWRSDLVLNVKNRLQLNLKTVMICFIFQALNTLTEEFLLNLTQALRLQNGMISTSLTSIFSEYSRIRTSAMISSSPIRMPNLTLKIQEQTGRKQKTRAVLMESG